MFCLKKLTLFAGAFALSLGVAAMTAAPASAEGYLARKATELEELVIGLGNSGFEMSQDRYEMETGKAYKLEIQSTGAWECAFEATKFFNFIWLRKLEVGEVEIKATHLYEIEFEREGEAELFFVPIKPGEYPFGCRGLEDRGLSGIFSVK